LADELLRFDQPERAEAILGKVLAAVDEKGSIVEEPHLRDALERLVEYYENHSQPDKAQAWRETLGRLKSEGAPAK
ncbi:MAG TPA: hypothetical protein VIY86_14895, partial [Pirellulaceae bacterium]